MTNLKLFLRLVGLFLLFSSPCMAVLSVRVFVPDDVTDPDVFGQLTGDAGSQYDLLLEFPSGSDGSLAGSPINIYIPGLEASRSFIDASLFSANQSTRGSTLPTFFLDNPPSSLVTIETEVSITNDEPSQHFLHVAVANNAGSNDWRIIGINGAGISNGVSQLRRNISFNIADFCLQSTAFSCNDLVGLDSITGQVYYFLASSNLGLGAQVNPTAAGFDNGVYFNVNISTRVYDTNLSVDLDELIVGDGSLSLRYQGSAVMNAVSRIIAIRHSNVTTDDGDQFIGTYPSVTIFDKEDYPSTLSGRILVEPLENGVETFLSVAFVDKFNYVTRVSNIQSATPTEIIALLREQSCFFFTAGFQRKHFVTERLQQFRSDVLMSFALGRKFVEFYYEIGPKYAPLVLDRPWLQLFIQAVGYTLVFVLDYGLYLVLLILGFVVAARIRFLGRQQKSHR